MQENKWKKEMPEIPENVHKAVLNALDTIETEHSIVEKGTVVNMKNSKGTSSNHTIKNIVKSTVAVAACAALLLTAATLRQQMNGNNQNGNLASKGDSTFSNLTEAVHDFSITAYAAEADDVETKEGSLIFTHVGIGEGGFTGMMFQIRGENIADVKLSLDRGELYTATIEHTTEEALSDWLAQGCPDEDNDPNTYTVMKLIPQDVKGENVKSKEVQLYHCTKKGKEMSESYNSEEYYGFYIPDDIVSEKKDLRAAYYDKLQVFQGSELKVAVTYKDGTIFEKKYALSLEKLMRDENGAVTQEVWNGGKVGNFAYGILAKEK